MDFENNSRLKALSGATGEGSPPKTKKIGEINLSQKKTKL